ncbi:MAG TPA: hypothetical protein VEK56_05295 [Vicinamibacterales bacterium]|nr:hypothetical protein [Vicinamibacterales bacterium]
MDDLPAEEYRALRATIAGRGGLRLALSLGGLSAWALTLVAILAWLPNPIAGSIPLVLLLATFEVNRMLHLGIERIGRFLQVFYEDQAAEPAALPGWERTAMSFGPARPGAGGHPLLLAVFIIATLVNFLAVVLPGPLPLELGAMAVPHVAFLIWIAYADRAMAHQRARDLARFEELKQQKR